MAMATILRSRFLQRTQIVIFPVLLVLLVSCSSQPDKYYSKVTINDDLTIELEDPVSDLLSIENTSHYEVSRDSIDRIVEIKKLSAERGRSIDFFLGIPTVRIEYTADYEKRTYFDEKGLPAKYNGFYSIRIKRNDEDNTITWFGYNQCGQLIEDNSGVCQYLRVLNDQNKKTEEMRFDRLGSPVTDNDGTFKESVQNFV